GREPLRCGCGGAPAPPHLCRGRHGAAPAGLHRLPRPLAGVGAVAREARLAGRHELARRLSGALRRVLMARCVRAHEAGAIAALELRTLLELRALLEGRALAVLESGA